MDKGKPPLTLHVQLGPPAVPLDEDGRAQEGRPAQGPNEGAEHKRELQGPELGQEGRRPAPAEAVGDLQGDEESQECWSWRGSPELQKNKVVGASREGWSGRPWKAPWPHCGTGTCKDEMPPAWRTVQDGGGLAPSTDTSLGSAVGSQPQVRPTASARNMASPEPHPRRSREAVLTRPMR